MAKALVSIITTCYNGAPYLDTYFKCILSQTYDNIELVFVNHASTDETESKFYQWQSKLLERGIRIIYDKLPINSNGGGYNRGLKLFTGSYFFFYDCDDLIEPEYVKVLAKKLDENQDFCYVHCNCSTVHINKLDSDITEKVVPTISKREGNILDLILSSSFYFAPPVCFMHRREDFLSTVPNGQLIVIAPPIALDYQMTFFPATKKGVGFVDDVLCKYVLRPDSAYHASPIIGSYEKAIEYSEGLRQFQKKYCQVLGVDTAKNLQIIEETYLKSNFTTAAGYARQADAKKYYKEMRKVLPFNLNLFIRYILCYFPWMQKIMRVVFRGLKLREPIVK